MDRFTEIDRKTWSRRELFALYTKPYMANTFAATVKLRAKNLVERQKARGEQLVPALLFIVTREISRNMAFTTAFKDGTLGYWDRMQPMYPVLNGNGTFTFHTARVEGSYQAFCEAYQREKAENAGKTGAYAGPMPLNGYIISIMPFLAFESFSFALKAQKNYFAPIIAIGKYDEQFNLPVSATVNHAVCDGFHLADLFDRIQLAFDNAEEYLSGQIIHM